VGAGEADPLQALDLAAGAQQLAEGEPVAELDAVGVDVLAQQGDLDDALGDQRLDLGEDVAGTAVGSLPRRLGTMQKVQVLLQPTLIDTQPRTRSRGGSAASRGRSRALEDLDLGALVVPGPVEQRGEAADVVGAEDDVDPGAFA
jgi:hypothetical protein